MTFYNHIENVRTMAINLTHGEPWHGARDKARMFDSLDAARREYMQLQAENDKLREERREYQATIDSLVDECADHKDENEKLHKLVSDMWHELNYMSVRAENGTNHCLDHMAAFDARMEDLGIEVDE